LILTDRKQADLYREEKLWGAITLDGLAARWAREQADKVAINDSGKSLTWGEVDAAVDKLAARFLSLGLEADNVVAVQLDNSVEMPLVLLAIFRANLIAAPLPPLWRHYEITGALAQIAPKAIITRTRIGDHDHAMMMRDVALETFSVRQVMAFGDDIPDGIMDINDIHDSASPVEALDVEKRQTPADHVATMCWWTDSDPLPRPIARCHNHWIAASLPTLLEAHITGDDTIISAQYMTGLGALACVFGPWLLSGAKLALHEPLDVKTFIAQSDSEKATLVVLPAPMSEVMANLFAFTGIERAVCIWPDLYRARQERLQGLGDWKVPVVDVCLLGEAALYAGKRSPETPLGQIPVGFYSPLAAGGDEQKLMETRVKGGVQHAGAKAPVLGGEILVRGPMVPSDGLGPASRRAFKADTTGRGTELLTGDFTATGIQCAISGTTPPMIEPVAPHIGVTIVGGLTVSLAELDQCYNQVDNVSEAVAFSVDDKLLGNRVCGAYVPRPGQSVSEAEIQAKLHETGLASYKIPARMIAVDSIPRHEDGTPDRDRLQEEI